jgi:predicted permease
LPLILTIIVAAAFLGSYLYNRWKTKPKQTTKK